MLEFILRKTILKKRTREEQDHMLLFKYMLLSRFLPKIVFFICPLVILLILLPYKESNVNNIILATVCIAVYSIFVKLILLNKKIKGFIENKMYKLFLFIYVSQCVSKGRAISKSDFEIIKKVNSKLYNSIMNLEVHGYSYTVCFDLLKYLKKGNFMLIGVKRLNKDEISKNKYTVQALYVYNNWCFDTYSQMQYPLEEVLRRTGAKVYKSFSYDDVKDKSYVEFRALNVVALQDWCYENDVFQRWMLS